jgi:hypothetical protein
MFSDDWLAKNLEKLCISGEEGALIVQDIWITMSDLKQSEVSKHALAPDYFAYQNNPYYFVLCGATSEEVEALLKESMSFVLVCVFCRMNLSHLVPGCEVDDGFIADISRTTEEIYVSAYDQEGLVIWRRTAANSMA